jgi:hypothetical protein
MRAFALVLLIFFLFSTSAFGKCIRTDATVSKIVKQLTVDRTKNDAMDLIEQLLQDPESAACSLSAELQTVDESWVRPENAANQRSAVHIVWVIRSLRYISKCRDFRAATSEKFASEEALATDSLLSARQQFLLRNGREQVPFFANWMSRDILFFAAEDAQSRIIGKWKKWVHEADKSDFGQCEEFNKWYF